MHSSDPLAPVLIAMLAPLPPSLPAHHPILFLVTGFLVLGCRSLQASSQRVFRGVDQRNLALQFVEERGMSGIVFFMDDDNTYTLQVREVGGGWGGHSKRLQPTRTRCR